MKKMLFLDGGVAERTNTCNFYTVLNYKSYHWLFGPNRTMWAE